MQNVFDLIAEDEAKALIKTRAEIAAEREAWLALPQSERDRICAEREEELDKKYPSLAKDEEE